jgi:tRNA pseudouridine38-40 synthase
MVVLGMSRYKLTLEYEGTRYSGWQIQNNATTVQGALSNAIAKAIGSMNFELMGSGRTDSGVHALAQVAHLEADVHNMPPSVLQYRINDALPHDISVLNIEKAHPRFHARHHAIDRGYLYQISQRRTAFGKRHVWWVKDTLDPERMAQACAVFEGFHDFRSFTKDDPEAKSTTVELIECSLHVADPLMLIRIRGSHFLWKMVRQMVGCIVEAGRGNLATDAIAELLNTQSSFPAKTTAPPSGLFLEFVRYEGDPEPGPVQPTIRM